MPKDFLNQSIMNMNVADICKGFSFVASNKKRMCDE